MVEIQNEAKLAYQLQKLIVGLSKLMAVEI